jgi:hypothetical protein
MTKGQEIRAKAVSILKKEPKGMRWMDLIRRVEAGLPKMKHNTIVGSLLNLDANSSSSVYKPARGVLRHTMYKEDAPEADIEKESIATLATEKALYAPFADWLKNELEECTKAIPLGGNAFKDKWGTPDVIGIRSSKAGDIVKFPTEIISAEIKLDSGQLITAFGQACSYKLFSHRSYLVIPAESSEADIGRLDALCRIFGIGLILFENGQNQKTEFQIRVRAARHEPDMFYVNKNMKQVEDKLFS